MLTKCQSVYEGRSIRRFNEARRLLHNGCVCAEGMISGYRCNRFHALLHPPCLPPSICACAGHACAAHPHLLSTYQGPSWHTQFTIQMTDLNKLVITNNSLNIDSTMLRHMYQFGTKWVLFFRCKIYKNRQMILHF